MNTRIGFLICYYNHKIYSVTRVVHNINTTKKEEFDELGIIFADENDLGEDEVLQWFATERPIVWEYAKKSKENLILTYINYERSKADFEYAKKSYEENLHTYADLVEAFEEEEINNKSHALIQIKNEENSVVI